MLDKCANPQCSTRFKYLRGGRLFRLTRRPRAAGEGGPHPPHRLEYFWLCCRCSGSRTLQLDAREEAVCVPLPSPGGQPGEEQVASGRSTLISAAAWRSIPLWNDLEGGWCCDE